MTTTCKVEKIAAPAGAPVGMMLDQYIAIIDGNKIGVYRTYPEAARAIFDELARRLDELNEAFDDIAWRYANTPIEKFR